jgi:hypothetical protein
MRIGGSIIILMLLIGVLFYFLNNVVVHAQYPADAVQSNPLSISWTYPTHSLGETFTVYVDVVNVVDLFAFQCGFRFNPTVLQVVSVTVGGFLGPPGDIIIIGPEPPWDNQNGIVYALGAVRTDPSRAVSGTGHLLIVEMRINPALWPPYSGTYPGSSVSMIDLTDANGDPCELILYYKDGTSEVTPLPGHIYDGSFSLSVVWGDINYDGIVDVLDASQVGLHWTQTVPPAPIEVDINRDGIIDIQDAAIIGLNWQKHG